MKDIQKGEKAQKENELKLIKDGDKKGRKAQKEEQPN